MIMTSYPGFCDHLSFPKALQAKCVVVKLRLNYSKCIIPTKYPLAEFLQLIFIRFIRLFLNDIVHSLQTHDIIWWSTDNMTNIKLIPEVMNLLLLIISTTNSGILLHTIWSGILQTNTPANRCNKQDFITKSIAQNY